MSVVREDPRWARVALLLNLVGTILLALSFQATSSDFRLVTATNVDFMAASDYDLLKQPQDQNLIPPAVHHYDKVFGICSRDRMLIGEGLYGNEGYTAVIISTPGCPDSKHAKSAAVINTEHPSFLYVGLVCSAFGFFIQLLIVHRRKTIAEINDEMRVLRKQRKLLELEAERKSQSG